MKARDRLHEIIFEADTRAGKAFDVALIWMILLSVALVVLDSVSSLHARFGDEFYAAEWGFTILFAIEYVLRLLAMRRPLAYAVSFFGVIDLLAVLPTFLSLAWPGTQSLLVIRVFRLLRVFRIFKLGTYVGEAQVLYSALHAARHKVTVFLFAVGAIVVSMGTLMYVVEGQANGFDNIPMAIYWAIVTMTTVGFGDITPQTPLGQFLASCLMILGYGVIAVPTGIVTTELARGVKAGLLTTQTCPSCSAQGHDADARHCKYCGSAL